MQDQGCEHWRHLGVAGSDKVHPIIARIGTAAHVYVPTRFLNTRSLHRNRTLYQFSPRMVCTSGSIAAMTNAFAMVAQSKESDFSARRASRVPAFATSVGHCTLLTTSKKCTGINAVILLVFIMHFVHTLQDSRTGAFWMSTTSQASGLVVGSAGRPRDRWSSTLQG